MLEPLHRIKKLVNEMRLQKKCITVFRFEFKRVNYYVLVRLYGASEKPNRFFACEMIFIDPFNLSRTLNCPVNSRGLDIGAWLLRQFFHIDYAPNLGDLFKQFYFRLNECIPSSVRGDLTRDEKAVCVRYLSECDSEDPNRIFCIGVRHNSLDVNGYRKHRSVYNEQKAQILRPKLFSMFKKDPTISFLFSTNRSKEKDDEQILDLFEQRERCRR